MEDDPLLNQFLSESTARDVDRRVARVLRDLGDDEPPLRLESVRELLRLDRAFYSTTEEGVLRETVHRLKVAGRQVIARPTLLLDVVRRRGLKALWLPDEKRILLDSDLPKIKHRWNEAHEIIHGLLPWHDNVTHGDPSQTLALSCHLQLEAEANYGAGRLLFLGDRFREHVTASALSFQQIKALVKAFGNSMTATLWRAVEALDVPALGLVSAHPWEWTNEADESVRYFIRSRTFASEFDGIAASAVFKVLPKYCRNGKGPLGEAEIRITDSNGRRHAFHFETFYNGHEALTLGVHRRIEVRNQTSAAAVT
ncbi:MAG: hypothetical protein U0836_24685 [Pirellulales bacterium]